MGWIYLSIPKLQWMDHWSLVMDKWLHRKLYNVGDYLCILGWKSIKSKMGSRSLAHPCGTMREGSHTVYPKKYAHGFCFAVLCCGYTLTDFPISIRLTSMALWQSNDCPSASKATLMNMDKCFMWIHYERLHNHNKAKHNKTVCIFLGIYCTRPLFTNMWVTYIYR